jgi:hypothetical protein
MLPFIPEGTEITHVTGSENINGVYRNYWSLIPLGGMLAVSDEYNEPVTLAGAATGMLTFADVQDEDTGSDNNTDIDNGDTEADTSGDIAPDSESAPTTVDEENAASDAVNEESTGSSTVSPNSTTGNSSNIEADSNELPKTGESNEVSMILLVVVGLIICCYLKYRLLQGCQQQSRR